MKKVWSCLLALTIVLLSAATLVLPAVADVPSYVAGIENGFGYGILEDGTAIVLDFPYDKENIVIPDTLGGHTVTEIADDAYHNAPAFLPSNIVSLSVPASLRAFGNSVFYYAESLREIILRPGNTAFTLDENGVLFNKGKTELVYYPTGKTDAKYSVPEGTLKIADCAFTECLNLKEIVLPASLQSCNTYSFSYCHHLESISVSANNPYYSSTDGVLFNKAKTVLYHYPCQNPRTVYYVPNTVTELTWGAFSYATCSNKDIHCTLTAVYLPVSVQSFEHPFGYANVTWNMGYDYPIETLTVYCENGSPLEAYCAEFDVAYAHWDGKVPTNPDETPSTKPDITVPSSDKTGENNATGAADNATVNIPNTAGSVKPAAVGATAMLAFSAVVYLCRKKEKTHG